MPVRGRPPLPLINSAVAFSLALLVTITVHEFAHAAAAVVLGFHPVVHRFSADPNVVTVGQQVTIDLAGPILSLLIGLGFLAISARRWSRSGFVQRSCCGWACWAHSSFLRISALPLLFPQATSGPR